MTIIQNSIEQMIFLLITLILIACLICFFNLSRFGKLPSGKRQERINSSPNFRNGQFQNQSHTPDLAEGVSYFQVFRKFFFGRSKRSKPAEILPSEKFSLHDLNPNKNYLVWFGHSSYFMQIDGKKILVDPVLSGHASPVNFTTRAFPGSDVYHTDDLPDIDYLFISHDHWDHLDHRTIMKLKPRIKKIITGLGVGAHFERWGFNPSDIIEKDWNENEQLEPGFLIHTVPSRHFSGRGLKRNRSLWLSFVLETPGLKIFIGGDSGYDHHFAEAGKKHGPFDLALLECGQYNEYWKYIHMMPEEVAQAAEDLKTKKFMPVHWSKFSLALHSWDDPILRVKKAALKKNISLIHPMIGQVIEIESPGKLPAWWEKIS